MWYLVFSTQVSTHTCVQRHAEAGLSCTMQLGSCILHPSRRGYAACHGKETGTRKAARLSPLRTVQLLPVSGVEGGHHMRQHGGVLPAGRSDRDALSRQEQLVGYNRVMHLLLEGSVEAVAAELRAPRHGDVRRGRQPSNEGMLVTSLHSNVWNSVTCADVFGRRSTARATPHSWHNRGAMIFKQLHRSYSSLDSDGPALLTDRSQRSEC